MSNRAVGHTRDAGWQIGVSRTIAVDLDTAWEYLTSPDGLARWLGSGLERPLAKGHDYETDDGVRGQVRSVRPHDRVRVTWQPADRADSATVQIALTPARSGTTFRFHTERLYDAAEREAMRTHWRAVADTMAADLVAG